MRRRFMKINLFNRGFESDAVALLTAGGESTAEVGRVSLEESKISSPVHALTRVASP
jgi:hypothetical protein